MASNFIRISSWFDDIISGFIHGLCENYHPMFGEMKS